MNSTHLPLTYKESKPFERSKLCTGWYCSVSWIGIHCTVKQGKQKKQQIIQTIQQPNDMQNKTILQHNRHKGDHGRFRCQSQNIPFQQMQCSLYLRQTVLEHETCNTKSLFKTLQGCIYLCPQVISVLFLWPPFRVISRRLRRTNSQALCLSLVKQPEWNVPVNGLSVGFELWLTVKKRQLRLQRLSGGVWRCWLVMRGHSGSAGECVWVLCGVWHALPPGRCGR